MLKRPKYIIVFTILLLASQAMGQYMDTVCIGTVARGYHAVGSPGSTYTWNVQGGVPCSSTNNDSIFVNWGNVPGIYPMTVFETSSAGCVGNLLLGNVWLTGYPWVDAGPTQSICSLVTTQLSLADSGWCKTVSWTTSGDGLFNNPNFLKPAYTPGPADIIAGTVTLTITGIGYGAGCPPSSSSVILRISHLTASVTSTPATCFGLDDGTALVSPIGGIPPYTYQWNDLSGQTTNPATGLSAGTYSVIVKDAINCTWQGSVTVIQLHPSPSAFLSLLSSEKVCMGDSARIRIALTGTPPWTLTYTDGTTPTIISGITTSPYFITTYPTAPAVYSIISLTDAFCTAMPSMIHGTAAVNVFELPDVEFTWVNGSQNNEVIFYIDTTITNIGAIGNMVLWNFGDGIFGYENNPVHLFPADNQYIVTLTVTDTNGCVNSVSHTVEVPHAPGAFFASDSPVCNGEPVCFTDLSTTISSPFAYITTWIWNYGDGSPLDTIHFPNLPDTCHVFTTFNLYPVTLFITDNNGYTDSYTRYVNMVPEPVANFVNSDPCAKQAVQFTDHSSANGSVSIISYQWNFGDPGSGIYNTSGLKDPLHIFSSGGNSYNVRLIVTNLNGCIDTIVHPVWVRPSPPVEFSKVGKCLGTDIVFTADTMIIAADSIGTWSWDFGDGSQPSANPVTANHIYTLTGSYLVTLTIMDVHGCYNSVTHSIEINQAPVALFSWNTPLCGNSVVHLDDHSFVPATAGFITQWHWDFGDGSDTTLFLPGSADVTHFYAVGGTVHLVTLTVLSDKGCMAAVSNTLQSLPAPEAEFSNSPITCPNQPVQFTDQSLVHGGGNIIQWSWNFNDPVSGTNNVSLLQNPLHSFSGAGIYQVLLVVMNANNCQDTIIKVVTIHAQPLANFSADTACLGHPTTFTGLSVPIIGNIISYSWNFGDGTVSAQPEPVHTYQNPGTFQVQLTIVNGAGCTNDTIIPVIVFPLPIAAFSYSVQNCVGTSVSFTDQSTLVGGYQGSIQRWSWDFGDGSPLLSISFPASPNIFHIFPATASSFNVKLTIYTSDSCSSMVEQLVTLMSAPVAAFTYPQSNCSQNQVQFTDASAGFGVILQWLWDFGDPVSGTSNISNLQHPLHSFSGPGSFAVTLIVTNVSGCKDTVTQSISILQPPVAAFSSGPACLGISTPFTNLSTAFSGQIMQNLWDFGDGSTSNLSSPVHTYPAEGTYLVRLSVWDNNGCTASTEASVVVTALPMVAFTSSTPTCSNDTVVFTDITASGTPIASRVWDFGDGTIDISNSSIVSHTYQNPGSYPVKLTVTTITAEGCSAQHINIIVIRENPVAEFNYSINRCAGLPVQFTAAALGSGTPITAWSWDFGDPASGAFNTSTLQNPVHAFSGSGSFTVSFQVSTSSGCAGSKIKTLDVNPLPVAGFTAGTACSGNAMQFTDGSVPNAASIASWLWDFGDPGSGVHNFSTLQNPSHIFTAAGYYPVTLMVINSNGCENDTVIQVAISQGPNAMFQYTSACNGAPTHFTDLSLAPTSQITSWLWDFGDGTGTSSIQNPDYTYASAGTFQVKLKVSNLNGCFDSINQSVVSNAAPVAAFTSNSFYCPAGQVTFQDATAGAGISERYWIFEPGATSSIMNPTYVFPVTDSLYPVMLIITDNNGCRDTVSQNVYVKKAFSFSMKYDTVCFNNGTRFQAENDAPGDSLFFIHWNFGDPGSGLLNTSSDPSPFHHFTHSGTFVVKLSVVNSDNCYDSIYQDVLVRALPNPEYSFVSPSCETITRFTDLSTAPGSSISEWVWDFGDGTVPLSISSPGNGNTEHEYDLPGTYKVTLTVTTPDGCADTISKMVNRPGCLAAAFLNRPAECISTPVIFTDHSGPVTQITLWRWTFGDGSDTVYTVFAPSLSHTYRFAGDYDVKLTILRGNGDLFHRDSVSHPVTVHWRPDAQYLSMKSCVNIPKLFEDKTEIPVGEEITRCWNFGDPGSGTNNNSTLQNAIHSFPSAGEYNVKLCITSKSGCLDSAEQLIQVSLPPQAAFSFSPTCTNQPIQFLDQTILADTTIRIWHWNFGESGTLKDTALISDPSYKYKKEGSYPVRLIVKDYFGCSDTSDAMLEVKPSPLSAFIFSENVAGVPGKIQLINKSEGADNFIWDLGNGTTSYEENPMVTFSEDGIYDIKLISTNLFGCSDSVIFKYDLVFRSLYVPNAFAPTCGVYGVRLFKPVGINLKQYKVEVFDAWGHLVWHSTAIDNEGRPVEGWDGRDGKGQLFQQGTYMWKINAIFDNGSTWEGSDIGKGEYAPMGIVTLIR